MNFILSYLYTKTNNSKIFLENHKNYRNKFKIIHISTDEVYGSLQTKDKSFNELNKFYPNSPYAASKASSDLLCRAWNKTYNYHDKNIALIGTGASGMQVAPELAKIATNLFIFQRTQTWIIKRGKIKLS